MHSFHIPVMGLGFTIDTPVKVAPYGISSVISIIDDELIEKMREYYCIKTKTPYTMITEKSKDYRAERITSYLNLIDQIVSRKFEEVKRSIEGKGEEINKLIEMLPDYSDVKKKFYELVENGKAITNEIKAWIQENIHAGSIDVNIMSKVDTENYFEGEKLDITYNDAHASLRGFANSTLHSSLVLSAGINPALYGYLENFDDFYPDANDILKKKIVLKVSDYRSAIIQGKYLAKKGIWVSEYRVESGLNCGGHAFATDGFLLGPILEEFKNKRTELIDTTHAIFVSALKEKHRCFPVNPLQVRVTAQGGVGTTNEHHFLMDYYGLDSIGWGTPFLLVPEVVNIDPATMELLRQATEADLYLSEISPLGVPFNTVRNNSQDVEKMALVERDRPGSSCPKKYLMFNKEFTEKAICTASRQYQNEKIKELDARNLDTETRQPLFDKIVAKACLCVGLANSALLENKITIKGKSKGVSICPGPNMAYFSKILSLREMIDHIYGRESVVNEERRPNIFVNELKLYVDYLRKLLTENGAELSAKQIKYNETFRNNLSLGIAYYKELYAGYKGKYKHFKEDFLSELEKLQDELVSLFAAKSDGNPGK